MDNLSDQSSAHESLVNHGVAVLNNETCPAECNIVVTGLARSGTTMIAKVLKVAGLELGHQLNPFLEDHELNTALKKKDDDRFIHACHERDRIHGKWIYKQPKVFNRLNHWMGMMNKPLSNNHDKGHSWAISLRNEISVARDLLEGLDTAVTEQRRLFRQIEECRAPLLLVSYEKALQYPDFVVRRVMEFCGHTVSSEHVSQLASLIVNGDEAYLDACRLTQNDITNEKKTQ